MGKWSGIVGISVALTGGMVVAAAVLTLVSSHAAAEAGEPVHIGMPLPQRAALWIAAAGLPVAVVLMWVTSRGRKGSPAAAYAVFFCIGLATFSAAATFGRPPGGSINPSQAIGSPRAAATPESAGSPKATNALASINPSQSIGSPRAAATPEAAGSPKATNALASINPSTATGTSSRHFHGSALSAAPIKRFIDKRFGNRDTRALLYALLTGDRSMMARSTIRAFRASGASHILALSGLHLGIIYAILTRILSVIGNSRIAYRIRAFLAICACGLFTLMTGAGPSITRAFLFIALNETARLHPERKRKPLNIYCTALTIQLSFSPLALTTTGFQLSYLAMLGIYILYPRLESWYGPHPKFDPMKRIWNSVAMSLSCQLFTGPLVWLRFGTFPIHFLLTNLLAIPLTEALIISALTGQAGLTDRLVELLTRTLEIIASM